MLYIKELYYGEILNFFLYHFISIVALKLHFLQFFHLPKAVPTTTEWKDTVRPFLNAFIRPLFDR